MKQWCSDTGQSKHKTVVPERSKTNLMRPKTVPAYCVKSFPAAVQRERTQAEHSSTPELTGQD